MTSRHFVPMLLAVTGAAALGGQASVADEVREELGDRAPRAQDNPAVAAKLREERIARKLANQRRRLPKGHPDRLEGPA